MNCPFHSLIQHTSSEKSISTEPERRKLLKGMLGVAGSALALTGMARAAAAENSHTDINTELTPAFDSENYSQEFYGQHQSGVITPQQASLSLIAFDVIAMDKESLVELFKTLTERCEFLMQGGVAPHKDAQYPPLDSGILGPKIHPDNLTITVSVGNSLFDERFGLNDQKPIHLQKMVEFSNDGLKSEWCHGDLLIQICANSPDTTMHALRDIIKHTPASLAVRWRRDGFISPYVAASMGKRTPTNLLGFKDGTINPTGSDTAALDKMLWVNSKQEPEWTMGGSYQAIRLIRFFVERWDRTPLQEQETIFGRNRDSGAPLGKVHERDDPDYGSDPLGKRVPLDSHMRLANPRTDGFDEFLILRRSYSYSYSTSPSGQLDVGLLFISYQADLQKGFIDTQKRLDGEPLEEYIKPFGGGYFFALPGVKPGEYLAQSLLQSV